MPRFVGPAALEAASNRRVAVRVRVLLAELFYDVVVTQPRVFAARAASKLSR